MEQQPHYWSSDLEGFVNGFSMSSSGFEVEVERTNGSLSNSSLVLDTGKGELVEAKVSLGKKGIALEKNREALRNHSEAERKRRARINAHLDTLRSIVPGANKMDKASLLAEVISHVKVLKEAAAEVSEDHFIPTDIDEIRVEEQVNNSDTAPYFIMVSLCCDHKPGLLSDLRKALDELHLVLTRAEIATLEGRMKNMFVITSYKEQLCKDSEAHKSLTSSVNQAIRSILYKFSATQEFSLNSTKRRKISTFDPSFSSSSADLW
ncbi:basic helix-loop-helix (bHLH) DNA-binding superfamily protein [Euphorbia peplus]|nr:basic helix-loop-helix (bHLH) DNA-binding superfamily protein [Euphorbia peplus]